MSDSESEVGRRVAWLVKPGARVLHVAVSPVEDGALTHLRTRGCSVTRIAPQGQTNRQPQPADTWISGRLEHAEVRQQLGDARFDVVILSDPLTFADDPRAIIEAAVGFIGPEGYLVAAVPNGAYGGARLRFLAGEMPVEWSAAARRQRFYTLDTLESVFHDCGTVVGHLERVELPLDAAMVTTASPLPLDELVAFLSADANATTSHFVAMAFVLPSPQIDAFRQRVQSLMRSLDAARHEVKALTDRVCALEAELAARVQTSEERKALSASLPDETAPLRRAVDESGAELAAKDRQVAVQQMQIATLQSKLEQVTHAAQIRIQGLEGSISWRLTAPLRAVYDRLARYRHRN